jgi:hypothetical protein
MEVIDKLVRIPRNYYTLRFDKSRPRYPFLVKEKGSKTNKTRKLTRNINLPPFWPFLKFLKSTLKVVDMLVRLPRNYYMVQFDKARPSYALFSERKMVKNE